MRRPWPLEHPTPKVVSPARTCPPRVIYPLHLVPIIYRYRASHLTPGEGGLATGGRRGRELLPQLRSTWLIPSTLSMRVLRGLRALGKSVSAVLPRASWRSYRERFSGLTESASAVLPRALQRSRYDRPTPIETFDTELLTLGSGSSSFLSRRTSQRLRPCHEIKSGRCTMWCTAPTLYIRRCEYLEAKAYTEIGHDRKLIGIEVGERPL